ncbi:MAG: NUDIX hydrolase [Candidatus Freyarchaeota archaeon]|nr:NUDIX hydrolase [Candidatus Jordarchaeia archaeon]
MPLPPPRTPLLAVDAVIIGKDGGSIIFVKRLNPPFKDYYALPGGFVEVGERLEEALRREVKEETGLEIEIERVIGIYDDPKRDPRGHVVTVAYLCREVGGELRASTDAKEARRLTFEGAADINLAFDHEKILRDAGVLGARR